MSIKGISLALCVLIFGEEAHACCDYSPLMNQVYEFPVSVQKEMASLITDSKLHIFFCGTGNPQVTMQEIRKPACLAVIGNNEFFLIDAGEGSSQTIASLALPYPAISKVFMTHWHSDHFAGLGSVINDTWKDGRTTQFDVYGPFGVDKVVNGINESYYLDALYRTINSDGTLDPAMAMAKSNYIGQSRTPKEVYNKNDVKVSAFSVDHTPSYPALGYTLGFKNCHVTVSGDTKVVDSLAKASQNVDVLISEVLSAAIVNAAETAAKADKSIPTTTLDEDLEITYSLSKYHANSYDLAKLAADNKVKNLFLTHLVPAIDNSDESKSAFVAGMSDYYKGPMTVANDKDHLILESTRAGCKVTFVPFAKSQVAAEMSATVPSANQTTSK